MIPIKDKQDMTATNVTNSRSQSQRYEDFVSKRKLGSPLDLITDEELLFELKIRWIL